MAVRVSKGFFCQGSATAEGGALRASLTKKSFRNFCRPLRSTAFSDRLKWARAWGSVMSQAAATDTQSAPRFLERIFNLSKSGSNVRTEFVAGLTTFLTMVYIVFVNPQILGNTGMDKGAVFVATCIAAAVSTAVMALYANYPIALAPGMGLNAFFAFTVVLGMKFAWQQALAAVFCSGVIFFLISVFRIREYIINSIPRNLKLEISAGVGLFLGIIALEEAKIVVASPATLVTLGDLRNPVAILCLLGLVLITALNY